MKKPPLRPLIAALLLCAGNLAAWAGAEPLPTDTFPTLVTIEFHKGDIVFDGAYRLNDSSWDQWQSPTLDSRKSGEYPQSILSCSLPRDVLERYHNDSDVRVVLCGHDKIWFSSGSYCAEGADIQGSFFSYDLLTSEVIEHKSFTPSCETIVGAARVRDHLWVISNQPGEYGYYEGSGVLIYDLKTNARVHQPPAAKPLRNQALNAIAYDLEKDTVWVVARNGIAKYAMKDSQWEHRYFDGAITSDNHLKIILSRNPPSENHLWMLYHVRFYPIDNLTGFASAWKAARINNPYPPAQHISLLPYYISALWNIDNSIASDFAFEHLIEHISSHQGGEEQIRSMLMKLQNQNLNAARRTAVVNLLGKYGIPGADIEMDKQFEALKNNHFKSSTSGSDREALQLCNYSFKNKKYLEILNIYLMGRRLDDNAGITFMDSCVRAYSMWPGAEAFMPSILKALKSSEPRLLYNACSIFNHYAEEKFRTPEAITPLLYARMHADQYPTSYAPHYCRMASYWIANSKQNIDALLIQTKNVPEINNVAVDVLREITGENFKAVSEYEEWWTSSRGQFTPSTKIYYWQG